MDVKWCWWVNYHKPETYSMAKLALENSYNNRIGTTRNCHDRAFTADNLVDVDNKGEDSDNNTDRSANYVDLLFVYILFFLLIIFYFSYKM